MRQFLQAIWWWIRVALVVTVGLYALLSLWNNTGKQIRVWYWFDRWEDTSIVALAVASFVAGGILCSTAIALFTATWRYRRTRESRQRRAIEEQREVMAKKAAMLRVKPPPTPIVKVKPVAEPSVVEHQPREAKTIELAEGPVPAESAIVVESPEPLPLVGEPPRPVPSPGTPGEG